MAFLESSVTLAVIFTISFMPLFFFRLFPFKNVLTHREMTALGISSAVLMLVNAVALVFLFRNWETISPDDAVMRLKLDFVAYYIVSAVPFAVVLRHYWRENLFALGTTGIFALLCLSSALVVVHYVPLNGILRVELLCGIMLFLGIAGAPFVCSTLRKTVTPFLGHGDAYYWRNIWIIPNAMLIACILTVPLDDFITTPQQLISRLLIGLATVLMCRSIAYDTVLFTQRVHLESQIDAQREYYKELSERMNSDRRARHDFHHQLSAIAAMAKDGRYEAIENYCRDILNSAARSPLLFTGNSALDSVIYRYHDRCEKSGFSLEVRGHFKEHHPMELDLCVVLGNALENAFTATMALPPAERCIALEVLPENAMLTITVKNSYDGITDTLADGTLLSRKRSHEEGYGLASMRTICEAHGGTMSVHYDDTFFAVMLMMNTGA